MPTDLHSENVMRWTKVHCELQSQLPNKFRELFGVSAKGHHIIHIQDEKKDGRPILSIFRIEAVVLIAPKNPN